MLLFENTGVRGRCDSPDQRLKEMREDEHHSYCLSVLASMQTDLTDKFVPLACLPDCLAPVHPPPPKEFVI